MNFKNTFPDNSGLSILLIAILFFCSAYYSKAQTQSKGLYLTADDYAQHKLSYSEDPSDTNGNKISIHEFIGSNNVTVFTKGKKLSFDKNQIFGYHDAGGSDYRFFDGNAYQIVDTAGFFIYSFDRLVQKGRGPRPKRAWYFSKKSNSPLLSLTFQNLLSVFPDNQKFRYMIEVASVYNVKPEAYDSELNEYKIKELYKRSLK